MKKLNFKMSSIYFVTLILFITIKQTTTKNSAVLIHGIKLPDKSVFPKIEKDDFKQILQAHVKTHTFFLTLVTDFNARQLSCTGSNEKCLEDFPSGDITYYGAVENPHSALEELFNYAAQPVYVDKQGKLKKTQLCEEGYRNKLNIIQIADKRRRREENSDKDLLRQRTNILNNIKADMANCDFPPLFFFMDQMSDGIEYNNDGEKNNLLVKSISTTVAKGEVIIDIVTVTHQLFDNTETEPKNLTIKVVKKPGEHTLVSAIYDGEVFEGQKLKWPRVFMLDAPGLVFTSGNKKLRLNKLQLERFSSADNTTKELQYSDDDWHTCVYVTPGILMGLMVAAILSGILFFGLTMIMNIKTNDRFDGPQMQALQFTTADN